MAGDDRRLITLHGRRVRSKSSPKGSPSSASSPSTSPSVKQLLSPQQGNRGGTRLGSSSPRRTGAAPLTPRGSGGDGSSNRSGTRLGGSSPHRTGAAPLTPRGGGGDGSRGFAGGLGSRLSPTARSKSTSRRGSSSSSTRTSPTGTSPLRLRAPSFNAPRRSSGPPPTPTSPGRVRRSSSRSPSPDSVSSTVSSRKIACASRCLPLGKGLHFRTSPGDVATFTIQSYDRKGAPRSVGGDEFSVTVYGSSLSKPAQCTVTDCRDGTYEVAYVLSMGGVYTMDVTLGPDPWEHIKGSPYDVHCYVPVPGYGDSASGGGGAWGEGKIRDLDSRVKGHGRAPDPLEVVPSMCIVTGAGILYSFTGRPTSFGVTLRNALGEVIPPPANAPVTVSFKGPATLQPAVRKMPGGAPGEYVVDYTCPVTGEYAVYIRCGSAPLGQSPYLVVSDDRAPIACARYCYCKGEGVHSGAVGHETEFTIVSHNNADEPLSASDNLGGFAFDVRLYDKQEWQRAVADSWGGRGMDEGSHNNMSTSGGGSSMGAPRKRPAPVAQADVENNRDGTFRVKVFHTRACQLAIEVLCDGTPIKGSPYFVNISPAPATAMGTEVSSGFGAAFHERTAGEWARVVITARDAFGNKTSGGEKLIAEFEYNGCQQDNEAEQRDRNQREEEERLSARSGGISCEDSLGNKLGGASVRSVTSIAARAKKQLLPKKRVVKPPEAQFFDNRDGTHVLSYHVDASGSWNMHIKLGVVGKESEVSGGAGNSKTDVHYVPICGSPWIVNAAPTLVNPKCCVTHGLHPTYLQSLSPTSFTITAYDGLGNRLHGGGLSFDVRLSSQELHNFCGNSLKVPVTDCWDGTYKVCLPINCPGKCHVLSCTCKQAANGAIAGFPVDVEILPSHVEGSLSTVTGLRSEGGWNCQEARCNVPGHFSIVSRNASSDAISAGGDIVHVEVYTTDGIRIGGTLHRHLSDKNERLPGQRTKHNKRQSLAESSTGAGTGLDDSTVLKLLSVEDNRNGTYEVKYQFLKAGQYMCFVYLQRNPDSDAANEGSTKARKSSTSAVVPSEQVTAGTATTESSGAADGRGKKGVCGDDNMMVTNDFTIDGLIPVGGSPFLLDVLPCLQSSSKNSVIIGLGATSAVRGTPAIFTVQARDRFCNVLSTGGEPFTISIRSSSAVRHTMTDQRDGSYIVTYYPKVSGNITVTVNLSGDPVWSSSVDVKGKSLASSLSTTGVDGDKSSTSIDGGDSGSLVSLPPPSLIENSVQSPSKAIGKVMDALRDVNSANLEVSDMTTRAQSTLYSVLKAAQLNEEKERRAQVEQLVLPTDFKALVRREIAEGRSPVQMYATAGAIISPHIRQRQLPRRAKAIYYVLQGSVHVMTEMPADSPYNCLTTLKPDCFYGEYNLLLNHGERLQMVTAEPNTQVALLDTDFMSGLNVQHEHPMANLVLYAAASSHFFAKQKLRLKFCESASASDAGMATGADNATD